MHIGLLRTGSPPADLAAHHGDYPAMVRRLLGPQHRYTSFDVDAGQLPPALDACDAYVVTGSSAGVHDGLDWIEPLAAFLRATRGHARLVGICFGHQIIAHAFGGTVGRAPRGWSLGLHRYCLSRPITGLGEAVVAMASHQDQVLIPPPDADTLGASEVTPAAILAYRDGAALTLQCHPEFDTAFSRALIALDRGIPRDLRDNAARSMHHAHDNAAIGAWLDRYIHTGSAA